MSGKRFLFATLGSLGDVYPYIALAVEMKRRGHRVAIATSFQHRSLIERSGIHFNRVSPECDFSDAAFQRLALHERKGSAYLLRDTIFPQIRKSYSDLLSAASEADLLVTHTLSYAGPLVAEKTQIPWVSTVLSPLTFFSFYDSPVLASRLTWLREIVPSLNSLVNRIARRTTRSWSEPVRQLRRDLGLPSGADAIYEGQHSPTCVLALFPSLFAKPQPDWPAQILMTGFPFWAEPDLSVEASAALDRFLASGPAPLVFTLGSSAVLNPGMFYEESVKAAQRLGLRSVLIGSAGGRRTSSSSDVFTLAYAPHSRIFSHACAIVHQGGIGTSARALSAGRPMLVVPFGYDQPDNAARLVRLGVARTLGRTSYAVGRAASELSLLMSDSRYKTKARRIADRINSEDGVHATCDALENCLRRERRLPAGG
ncbi:MAG: glycosyltransferase [Bryobacteraceae bacterium]